MSKELTISVVNYNMKESILKCLESISANTKDMDIDVYVVDNDSMDKSVDAIREFYPNVHLIDNKVNNGFAKANNQVLRVFDSKYCLITNPDVIVYPDTLQSMVSFMDSTPDAGVVACKILNTDQTLQYSCRTYPTVCMTLTRGFLIDALLPGNKIVKKYLMMDCQRDTIMPVDWVTGCCLMIRKETINDVGLLDENYFMYFEDADFCYRVNKNWKVYYYPHVNMVHEYQHKSRSTGNLKHKIHHMRSAIYFFRKYGFSPDGHK